jgi:hypothetical protein
MALDVGSGLGDYDVTAFTGEEGQEPTLSGHRHEAESKRR